MTFIRSSATAFSTVYEEDWTQEPALDIKAAGDGAFTLGSRTWTAASMANCSKCEVTPGVGLEFVSSVAGFPLIQIATTEISADFSVTRPWRVWTRYSNFGPDQNFEDVMFIMAGPARLIGCLRSWSSGSAYSCFNGITSGGALNFANPQTADNLLIVESSGGVMRILSGLTPGAAGVLPATTKGMHVVMQSLITGVANSPAAPMEDNGNAVWRIGLQDSLAANSCNFEALRIEVG